MDTKEKKKPTGAGQKAKRPTGTKTGPARRPSPAKKRTPAKQTAPAKRASAPKKAAPYKPRKKEQPVNISPEVVYLPPKPFSRNRLLLHLATIAAVVVALVLGLSVFFKVDAEKITVSGTDKYTAWDVAQASGIEDGASLLTFSRDRAVNRILDKLKYVRQVRIGIKLPDTVHIEIVEIAVTYAVEAADGSWWMVSSDGKVIEPVSQDHGESYTKIYGLQIENPKAGQQAVACQPPQTETDGEGNLVPVTVTAAQKLSIALDITGYLERNSVIGGVASIDVSNAGDLQLWYGDRFHVLLGDKSDLATKVCLMKNYLDGLKPYEKGILYLSDIGHYYYDPK